MTKTELVKQIEDDLTLSPENLESMLYKIPVLHSKYLGLLLTTRKTMNKMQKDLSNLYLDKYKKLKDDAVLLDKKEIQFHILADPEYSSLNYKFQGVVDLVDVLDRTLKRVGNLSFDAKNLIEYIKFMNGS